MPLAIRILPKATHAHRSTANMPPDWRAPQTESKPPIRAILSGHIFLGITARLYFHFYSVDYGLDRHRSQVYAATEPNRNFIHPFFLVTHDEHVRNLFQLRIANFLLHWLTRVINRNPDSAERIRYRDTENAIVDLSSVVIVAIRNWNFASCEFRYS
jgi:hypothetical protein